MDYISSTFTLRKIVQKGDAYQDSKALYKMEKKIPSLPFAKDDISLIERVGDNRPKQFNSHPDSKAIPAPLEAGTVVGHLTYEDNDLIGQGYITTERP